MSNKEILVDLYKCAVKMSLPEVFIPKHCSVHNNVLHIQDSSYNLLDYQNIYLFGSGKASIAMAAEMEKILGDKIKDGLVITNQSSDKLIYTKVCKSSHPILTDKSIECAKKLIKNMGECAKDDFYIYLLSGGSSSLIEIPKEHITLDDLQKCNKLMLEHSLKIQDINTVRKHLSQIKGGKLAGFTKASGIVLVLSDVVGDDISSIGSAPLYQDSSTCKDAIEILKQAGIYNLLSSNIIDVLNQSAEQSNSHVHIPHFILASNKQALQAAYQKAVNKNLNPMIIEEPMIGDVEKMYPKMLKYLINSDIDCFIFGGECTVFLKKMGKGGRSQHLALLMLKYICTNKLKITFLSAGTDGIDGNSDAAGGIVDFNDCSKICNEDIWKYLGDFNSYEALKQINGLIITGNSGTNVTDIAILLRRDD